MKRIALVIIITIGLFSLLIGGMELYYYVVIIQSFSKKSII